MAKEQNDTPKEKITRNSLSYWVLISTVMISSGLVIVIILGILFFAPEMLPITPKPAPEVVQRVDTLSSKVASLSNQVKTMEQQAQSIKPGIIQNRLSNLEARLANLSGSADKMQDVIKGLSAIKQGYDGDDSIVQTVTKMSKLVSTLDSRVETIQAENKEIQSNLSEFNADDIKAANMLLIATQFQGSVDRGIPFANELQAIQAIFNTDEEAMKALTRLQPFSGQGIPSKETLSQELDSLSNGLLKAALAGDKRTVRNTLKSKLSQYVKIYQDNTDLPLGDTQSILRRAKGDLERGDVNGAILALSEIKGPAATLIEPFFNQAEAHILAERLSKRLSDKAVNFIRDSNIGSSASTPTKKLY